MAKKMKFQVPVKVKKNENQLWLDKNGNTIKCKHNIEFLLCKYFNNDYFFITHEDIFIRSDMYNNNLLAIYVDIDLRDIFINSDNYNDGTIKFDSYPNSIPIYFIITDLYIENIIDEINNEKEYEIDKAVEKAIDEFKKTDEYYNEGVRSISSARINYGY